MINITDLVTLRQYALEMAIKSDMLGLKEDLLIQRANNFADFIKGNAELPEFDVTCDESSKIGFALINPDLDCCGDCDDYEDGIELN